ncbi:hypothetical protein NFX31_09110 [Microbacterium azadirachtae]|uniref:Uncharacterized protein n=1 Tax=Microbacterium azadirachtae TaxID=582680 RepID=A0A0F0KF90_9MICO|nr:hypothetical protein [Microbacterium azadirachtae]KJL18795.1 hypothetical protein RL72_03263 [Microbacterium azadirachtae]UXW84413.1 hypothetical protein NFX31_09110 [Microbacterium azadirachtae]
MSIDEAAPPRTATKPMAFDSGEFAAGAARAVALHLALFLILSGLASLVMGMFHDGPSIEVFLSALSGSIGLVLFVGVYAVPISLIATVLGILPALLLGQVMVRVRTFRTHVLVWCAFGVVFSGAVSLAVSHLLFRDQPSLMSAFLVTGFLSGSAAIPLAWARTASIALRADQGITTRPWFRRRRRTTSAVR